MASHFHGPFSTCKWHPTRYTSWASEVGGRWWKKYWPSWQEKKCFINSVGKRKRVLSQTESLQVSSSLGSTVGKGDERASSGKRPYSLTGRTQNNTSTAVHQINPPGRISVVRTHLADLELQNMFNKKGWNVHPGRGEGAVLGHCSISYLLQFVDSIL